MNEISLRGVSELPGQLSNLQQKPAEQTGKNFEALLNDSLKEVNDLQLEADKAIQELAAGKKENIHATMIAIEKASISFQLMMQIRNKIVEAYNEIMKMQA